jgi:hypothetical protein
MNNDTDNDTGWLILIASMSFIALFSVAIFTIPAWIPLVLIVVIAIVASGNNLDGYYEQDLRREKYRQAEDLKRRLERKSLELDLTTPIEEQQQEAYRKAEVLANDTERTALLKDLAIIDVDVSKFEMVDKADIEKALTKEERIVLREMRGFLK